jgi:hypothetical protein
MRHQIEALQSSKGCLEKVRLNNITTFKQAQAT